MTVDDRQVVTVTQKWVTVRDAYGIEVVEGIDPFLAQTVLRAVDRWVERD
jgi:uncharacterized protein YxjI